MAREPVRRDLAKRMAQARSQLTCVGVHDIPHVCACRDRQKSELACHAGVHSQNVEVPALAASCSRRLPAWRSCALGPWPQHSARTRFGPTTPVLAHTGTLEVQGPGMEPAPTDAPHMPTGELIDQVAQAVLAPKIPGSLQHGGARETAATRDMNRLGRQPESSVKRRLYCNYVPLPTHEHPATRRCLTPRHDDPQVTPLQRFDQPCSISCSCSWGPPTSPGLAGLPWLASTSCLGRIPSVPLHCRQVVSVPNPGVPPLVSVLAQRHPPQTYGQALQASYRVQPGMTAPIEPNPQCRPMEPIGPSRSNPAATTKNRPPSSLAHRSSTPWPSDCSPLQTHVRCHKLALPFVIPHQLQSLRSRVSFAFPRFSRPTAASTPPHGRRWTDSFFFLAPPSPTRQTRRSPRHTPHPYSCCCCTSSLLISYAHAHAHIIHIHIQGDRGHGQQP